jgi:hypothetical protein
MALIDLAQQAEARAEERFRETPFGRVIYETLERRESRLPLLRPTQPPRRRRRRPSDPFDFFGTLFTAATPATTGLNSMTLLNQTI